MAMIHLEPQTAQMFSRALGALKPPPNLTLSQWADSYRRLSAEASAAQGRWNTDNAPFQREIMDAIGDVHIRKVVAMMCAQSGKTDGLILNTIGYYMSYYPAPIMIVQPTVNLGESFSKDRLATMIRDTPVLRGLVDNKSRYSGNTIMKKELRRWSTDHRWRKRPDRSARPPHQGAAGGRGGRLQSQRRQRRRPGHVGRTASNDLLGLQDGAGVYPH